MALDLAATADSRHFESADLKFLKEFIEELTEEFIESDDYLMQDSVRLQLKRLVIANAQPGERDAASLRIRVLPSLFEPRGGRSVRNW
jgi:hypothetical protein